MNGKRSNLSTRICRYETGVNDERGDERRRICGGYEEGKARNVISGPCDSSCQGGMKQGEQAEIDYYQISYCPEVEHSHSALRNFTE